MLEEGEVQIMLCNPAFQARSLVEFQIASSNYEPLVYSEDED